MNMSGPNASRPKTAFKVAIYDAPSVMADSVSRALSDSGHTVIYEGPLRMDTARPDADIWLTKWSFLLKGPLLREARPQKALITMSVGTEHIDLGALKDHGVKTENCPTFSSMSVAEHAITLAMRSLHRASRLPPLSEGRLIFNNFSDNLAEQALAHILFRSRQIEDSIARARKYDYRRLDEPWANQELGGLRIGIAGDDLSSFRLAKMLRLGFNCEVFGYEVDEELETVLGVKPLFFLEMLDTCDYVFLCSESRFGFQIDPQIKDLAYQENRVDTRRLGEPDMPMSGSHVAVLGTGRIGSAIARICRLGFNCRVTAYNTSRKEELTELGVRYAPTVTEAISGANFIFIALPLNDGTRNLLGGSEISSIHTLSRGRVLVNVTRDEIVDSEAVFEFLSNGGLISYATDVLPKDKILWSGGEPDDATRKFVQHSSVIATPHEGDCSRDSLRRLSKEVLDRISNLMDGA
ncbi:MAG: NAD(P)-dependent oxidoreductase [Candidatus Micrarchaeia archaeon]